jgi:hypothetical protein
MLTVNPEQLPDCPKHHAVTALGAGITWKVTGPFTQAPLAVVPPPASPPETPTLPALEAPPVFAMLDPPTLELPPLLPLLTEPPQATAH